MDGENNGNTLLNLDDLGGKPTILGNPPYLATSTEIRNQSMLFRKSSRNSTQVLTAKTPPRSPRSRPRSLGHTFRPALMLWGSGLVDHQG